MTIAQRTLQAARQLAELLGGEIHPAAERGYYRLSWGDRAASVSQATGKPANILARLLKIANVPAAAGGGGLTLAEAGELAGLVTAPSFEGLAGWEESAIQAALPETLREALRASRKRRREDA